MSAFHGGDRKIGKDSLKREIYIKSKEEMQETMV